MPPIIIGVAVLASGAVAAWAGGTLVVGWLFTVAEVLFSVGTSMIISGAAQLLSGLLGQGNGIRTPGMIVSTRDPNAPWRIVYGHTRIAGVVTFMNSWGTNNEFLGMVLTLGKGKFHSIDTMYFDGTAIPLDGSGNGTGQWAGLVHAQFDVGDPANSAQGLPDLASDLPGYWTSTHLQRGHAKAYVRLKWNANIFSNGVPNITFDVHGREIYDPRSSTTGYSENTALCIRDYLLDANLGLGCAAGEIDDTTITAAANICDTAVSLKGTVVSALVHSGSAGTGYVAGDLLGVGGGNGDASLWVAQTTAGGAVQRVNVNAPGSAYSNGANVLTTGGHGSGLTVDITTLSGSEPTYNANGAFESTLTPQSVLDNLALAMAGYVTYVQGTFKVFAGAWVGATATLGDDDFIAPLSVQTRFSRRDLFNSVHGTYLSPGNAWQPSDFPAIQNSGYIALDGTVLWQQINLPFTISAATAQRIAEIVLQRVRRQITVTARCKLTAAAIQPADIVQINHARFGWVNKTFEVQQVQLISDDSAGAPALGVDLILRESDSGIFTWTNASEVGAPNPASANAPASGTVQPPTTVAVVGATLAGAVALEITWVPPVDQFVVSGGKILIQYKASSSGTWLPGAIVSGSQSSVVIGGLNANTNYDVQLWAENTAGAESSIVQVLNTPSGSISSSGFVVNFSSSAAGNLSVAHTLGRAPSTAVITMTSPGEVWFQTPTLYDASNLYLTAAGPGLTGYVTLW